MLLHDLDYVLKKLHWMRDQHIWPNGLRYLWTDAFGLVLLVSLYNDLCSAFAIRRAFCTASMNRSPSCSA